MQTTRIVIALTVVLLAGYDVFAALQWGNGATISYQIFTLSHQWIIIPFAFGYLMGHFFSPQRQVP